MDDWLSSCIADEARRLGRHASISDDVQQGCAFRFLNAQRNRAIFNPRAYVAKVLRSCVVDHYRRCRRDIPPVVVRDTDHPVVGQKLGASRDPADLVALQIDVRAAISLLSPREQVAIHRHYLDGIPVAEIAATLQLPKSTIQRTLSRGRKQLRERGLKRLP